MNILSRTAPWLWLVPLCWAGCMNRSVDGLNYPLLQDENTRHVDAYGIRNLDYGRGEKGYGIPHPGILFITRDGTVP